MSEKPEALILADELEAFARFSGGGGMDVKSAAELRRLHAENERLREALTYDWDQLEACRESLREHMVEIKRLREALKLAFASHGRMLMSDPPQDAWKFNRVDEVIVAALRREGASDGLSAPSGPACHATDNGAVGAGSRRGATSGPTPE